MSWITQGKKTSNMSQRVFIWHVVWRKCRGGRMLTEWNEKSSVHYYQSNNKNPNCLRLQCKYFYFFFSYPWYVPQKWKKNYFGSWCFRWRLLKQKAVSLLFNWQETENEGIWSSSDNQPPSGTKFINISEVQLLLLFMLATSISRTVYLQIFYHCYLYLSNQSNSGMLSIINHSSAV